MTLSSSSSSTDITTRVGHFMTKLSPFSLSTKKTSHVCVHAFPTLFCYLPSLGNLVHGTAIVAWKACWEVWKSWLQGSHEVVILLRKATMEIELLSETGNFLNTLTLQWFERTSKFSVKSAAWSMNVSIHFPFSVSCRLCMYSKQTFALLRTGSFWHLLQIDYTKFSVCSSIYLFLFLVYFQKWRKWQDYILREKKLTPAVF